MVLGLNRIKPRADNGGPTPIRSGAIPAGVSKNWQQERGALLFEAQVDVLGGFPGFADRGGWLPDAQFRITEHFVLVDEGAPHGFGLPLKWIDGSALIAQGNREDYALRIFYHDGAGPRLFTLRFRASRIAMRGVRRSVRAQDSLHAAGLADRFSANPPAEPNFTLPWDQTAQFESENVIWMGRANAPAKVGRESIPSDIWLTTKSLIWGSGDGMGVNRVPLPLLMDTVATRLRDRLGTPSVYVAIGDENTGRFEIPFVFDIQTPPDRNFRERGAFLVGLRSRGVPEGTAAPYCQPWRVDVFPTAPAEDEVETVPEEPYAAWSQSTAMDASADPAKRRGGLMAKRLAVSAEFAAARQPDDAGTSGFGLVQDAGDLEFELAADTVELSPLAEATGPIADLLVDDRPEIAKLEREIALAAIAVAASRPELDQQPTPAEETAPAEIVAKSDSEQPVNDLAPDSAVDSPEPVAGESIAFEPAVEPIAEALAPEPARVIESEVDLAEPAIEEMDIQFAAVPDQEDPAEVVFDVDLVADSKSLAAESDMVLDEPAISADDIAVAADFDRLDESVTEAIPDTTEDDIVLAEVVADDPPRELTVDIPISEQSGADSVTDHLTAAPSMPADLSSTNDITDELRIPPGAEDIVLAAAEAVLRAPDPWGCVRKYEEHAVAVLSDALSTIDRRVAGENDARLSAPAPSSLDQSRALTELAENLQMGLIDREMAARRRQRLIAIGDVCVRLRTLIELHSGGYLEAEQLDHKRATLVQTLSAALVGTTSV